MATPNTLQSVLGSVEVRPARESIYPTWPGLPTDMDLPPNDMAEESLAYGIAISYMGTILPDVEMKPLSNEGTTAVVLHDNWYAYKVFRQRGYYDRVENEAAALHVLGQEGIAPELVMLIDAARDHRYVSRYPGKIAPVFGGEVAIPRITSVGHLPVIVTELQDVGTIDELPAEKLASEFDRFALAALKHGLLFEDCEFLYDRRRNRATVIDVGEVYHPEDYLDEGEDKGLVDARLVQNVLVKFGSGGAWPEAKKLAPASRPDRLAKLHPVLYEYCGSIGLQQTTMRSETDH